MTIKATILGLLVSLACSLTQAGSVMMCSQNGATDPGSFLQFSIDKTEQQLIFIHITGKFDVCDYEELTVETDYNYLCEVEKSDGQILNLHFKFLDDGNIAIKEFLFNGPYDCID